VVIVIDALRADRVGDPRFPNLARLANEGLRFERALSTSSSTSTSLPAMITGRVRPSADVLTAAERLRSSGKSCVFLSIDAVVDSLRGQLPAAGHYGFPFERGFRTIALPTQSSRHGWGGGVTRFTADQLTARAVELLQGRHPPDLLWVQYFDVHQWRQLTMEGLPDGYERYDVILERVDAALAPLMERRDRFNLVLTSDHGEGLGARGYMHHTMYVVRELVHVPLIVRVPGQSSGVVEATVGMTELAPTLLDLAGLPAPPEYRDRSLLALWGVADPGTGPPVASFESREWSLASGRYRLLFGRETGRAQLYDVVRDPEELSDLAAARPDLVRSYLATLHVLRQQSGLPAGW